MAISMQDEFLVRAPIGVVWDFLMDPNRVAACMPGARLESVESERAFTGSIQIALGPFKTTYSGRVQFTEVDEVLHHAHMSAEGHERGSGAATGQMISRLEEAPDGTMVYVDVTVEGTSRLINRGLSFGENLAHELFDQFVSRLREQLEVAHGTRPVVATPKERSVQVVPLLAKAFARRFRPKPQPE